MDTLVAVLVVPVALFLLAVRVRRSLAARVTLIVLALLVVGLFAWLISLDLGDCCGP
jgi:hypothetical protein